MTDLQLGLLVVGAAVVAVVLAYNRAQERKVQRDAQRAFASGHSDALMDEPSPDRKSVTAAAIRQNEWHLGGEPDGRVDYVVELEIARGTLPATVLENWRPFEHRFARRAFLSGSDGGRWSGVVAGDVRSLTALRAALQMVSRSGVAADAELVEFRSAAETLAAALGAKVSAPEMRDAVEAARALDKLCSDTDIQVALHVVGGTLRPPHDMAHFGSFPFQVEGRADGISLVLDVPRSDDANAFETMSRQARDLAAKHGARVVDDNGNELDERHLSAINVEVGAVRARLAAAGIEPGSELALRLFS